MGTQDGDQAKATGDGAVTPGDRSAPDDEEDDHADQEGEPAAAEHTFFVFGFFLLAVTGVMRLCIKTQQGLQVAAKRVPVHILSKSCPV